MELFNSITGHCCAVKGACPFYNDTQTVPPDWLNCMSSGEWVTLLLVGDVGCNDEEVSDRE